MAKSLQAGNTILHFTPAANGVHTLIMHHTVKEIYRKMKLDYNSSATISVGNELTGNDACVNDNVISLFSDAA